MTPEIRSIVCATDLSAASLPAWEQAQFLGRLFDAEVVLLHVIPPVSLPLEGYMPPSLLRDLLDAGERDAHEALARLRASLGDSPVRLSVRVEDGVPAHRILDVATDLRADLIVMGTHGRTGLGRAILGSVADRVVRLATRPVLITPAAPEGLTPAPARLARICYATDFSPAAAAAWPWALALAQAAGAEIDLLHVAQPAVPDPRLAPDTAARMANLMQEHGHAQAEAFLRDCPLPRERIHVIIGHGLVTSEILHWARQRSADLIVIGTQGWAAGILRWMLGSVAHHIIQTAPRPVLTVGPPSPSEERPHVP